ncbi:hypothetical protein BM127P2_00046 [Phocaeicola phage BM127P2]|nr:hypothetical protein BM127P1_00031 [Phocaeicola phage BM127P1]WAX08325.1 hypothetical protein BM127P2_00046 [Phocaeicola phage BM127P2]WAX08370.1 hypothetical protein BM127P3_00044 [Phocaeicola phage BM127P3]WAX08419.1 hypothetical protein BM127P4_00046 [Phocaeicola phage BM127P4]
MTKVSISATKENVEKCIMLWLSLYTGAMAVKPEAKQTKLGVMTDLAEEIERDVKYLCRRLHVELPTETDVKSLAVHYKKFIYKN